MNRPHSLISACLLLAMAVPALAEQRRSAGEPNLTGPQGPSRDFLILGGGNVELAYSGSSEGNSVTAESYLEVEKRGFYGGVFGSLANDSISNEVDLYLGYRHDLASGFGYDLGYRRYFYPKDGGDCCGQLTAGFSLPLGEAISLGVDVAYDPENSVLNGVLSAEYSLNDRWSLSTSYGTYEQSDKSSETKWDVGTTYSLTDRIGLDARYNGSNLETSNVALSLVFDTTLFRR